MFTSLKITNTKLDLYVHEASISHRHGELFGISTIIEKKKSNKSKYSNFCSIDLMQ